MGIFQVVLHSPIDTTVTVVRMSDEQDCSWKSVLRHCDGIAGFEEKRGIIINVCNCYVDLGGAVNWRGVSVGLENQQDVWLRLMVQRFDVADQTEFRMNRKQTPRVSRRNPIRHCLTRSCKERS